MSALIQKGDLAREWVLTVARRPHPEMVPEAQRAYAPAPHRQTDGDIDLARALISHTHARVRDEALNTLIA